MWIFADFCQVGKQASKLLFATGNYAFIYPCLDIINFQNIGVRA